MNFGQTAKSILATVAPLIGTAFGGPLGGLAGNFLASKLGTPPGDQKALEAAVLSGSPDIMLKMKEANDAFQSHLADLGVQEDQLAYADTASARQREMSVKDWTPRIIAYLVIVLVLVAEGSMFFRGQPQGIDGVVLGRILGTLDSALLLVLGYYFGSSAGSAEKNAAINKIVGVK
jgi:hypothetical protein